MKEKKSNKRFADFPAAILYLDDLKVIANAVSSIGESLEITCGNFELESVDEIDELAKRQTGTRFDAIYIKSYRPHMTIDLIPYGVTAYIGEDTPQLRGVVHKVEEVIKSRQRKYFEALHNAPMIILMLGAFLNFAQKEYATAATYLGLCFVSIFFIVGIEMKHKLVVHTYPKNEVTSFFKRRKDELILAAISALLGGVVVILLGRLFS